MLHLQTFCLDDVFPQKICDFMPKLQVVLENLLTRDRILFQCILSDLLSKCFMKV